MYFTHKKRQEQQPKNKRKHENDIALSSQRHYLMLHTKYKNLISNDIHIVLRYCSDTIRKKRNSKQDILKKLYMYRTFTRPFVNQNSS